MSVVFGAHDIVTQAEGNPTRFFFDELIIVSATEPPFYGHCFGQLPLFYDQKMSSSLIEINEVAPKWV